MEGGEANLHQQTLPPENKLSRHQKKLLRRFAKRKTDEQIAKEFGCHADLIAAQRQTLMEKLEIRSQAQLATAARQFANWPRPKPRQTHNKIVSC
jgi:DNA-binding CsgD family transcriptional regulator